VRRYRCGGGRSCGCAASGPGRPRGDHSGGGGRYRHRYIVAQQRGDPRRNLLSGRQPDGADVRQRQTGALSVLRGSRHSASQLRQADRCHKPEGNFEAAIDQGACRSQWRARSANPLRRSGARPGAGAELRRRPALAFNRYRRQPCLHAGAARGRRSCRRGVRLSYAVAARQGGRGPDRTRRRRRRADQP